MATSIAEQIAAKVQTRLTAISTGGGYETTAAQVVRPKRINTFQPKDYTLVVTQENIVAVPELSCPGNPPATAWRLSFLIAGVLRQSESDTTAIEKLKNQFWADCVKALNTGTSWWNWDGLAIDSTISDVGMFQDGDGSDAGFRMSLAVTFRTSENDPYTQR